jgi:arylsulfatase A
MNRRSFLKLLGLGSLAAMIPGCATRGARRDVPRPNFVLILADDLGYGDIGCYGSTRNRTPHLDRLAKEGMRFTDFHSNGPMCSPTRAALLTGQYQHRFGREFETALSAKARPRPGLPPEAVTIPEALKQVGYATGMFGKWHLGYEPPHLPTQHGFDEFRGLLTGDGDHHSHIDRSGDEDWWHDERIEMEAGYTADLVTKHSIDFMERHAAEPFFLYVSHLAIHFPWQSPDESGHRVKGDDCWNLTKLGPHDEGQVRPVVQSMVEALDRSVGQIIAALKQLGLAENTFVFFASDNGGYLDYADQFRGEISSNGPLRGQKGDLFEGGHRVPAIAWWPGRIEAGAITDEIAMTMDLMPTYLNLADGTFATSDGCSLTPLLFAWQAIPSRTLFWRKGSDWAVRKGSWKLVGNAEKTMLFNLDEDIAEQNDLAQQRPHLSQQLHVEYRRWARDVTSGTK